VKGLVLTLLMCAGFGAVAVVLHGPTGPVYTATFADPRGLIAGNDVRVYGAPAGNVRAVSLTDDGHARVTFTLKDAAARPRADATAAIRPVDLLGDNYLSLDPGTASLPPTSAIGLARTSNAARLDDVLSTFTPDVRDGLHILLVEGGIALDGRGGDLARVSAALTPALDAGTSVVRELDRQNAAVARVVAAAERTAGQLARHEGRLGPLVESLNRTLATTAQRAPALSAAVRGAPQLLARMTRTAHGVAGAARSAQPLATSLAASAQPLAPAVAQFPQLLQRAQTSASNLTPAVTAIRALLVRAAPTLHSLAKSLPVVRAAAPRVDQLLAALEPAAPLISAGFFDNFADQAAEPGNQPFDPFADPRRAYWRGAAVFSCESFGVPVRPSCLQDVLGSQRSHQRRAKHPQLDLPAVRVPAPKLPSVPKPRLPDVPHPHAQTPATPPQTQQLLDFLLGR
jgi:phospholipid/cholesterol/gamma-HCH transport system substrate-binding protein